MVRILTKILSQQLQISLFANTHIPLGYDQRVEVFGENGMLQVQNQPKTSMVACSPKGITQDVHSHSFPERFNEAYANEVDHFVDIITNGVAPKVTRKQAKMSTIIAEAAKISAQKNTLVKLVDGPNIDDVDYEYAQVNYQQRCKQTQIFIL